MQARVLVRARGLAAFRAALVELARSGPPLAARRRAILVPTRASAELFRQTLERSASAAGDVCFILPDLLTREDWLTALQGALVDRAPLLSRVDREVLLERAARETEIRRFHERRLFELRPGLVAAVLDFYDGLKRRQRNVRRFAGAAFKELAVERGTDQGSESLIQLTRFLGFTFLAYERHVRASGALDEHMLRERLLSEQPVMPFDELIVAVADHPSDPRGLWPADFDLLGRLRALRSIHVVVTDETHDAGFRERLEQELPGFEERRAPESPHAGRLVVPTRTSDDAFVFISRDREEELRAIARAIRQAASRTSGRLTKPVAIVFQRPLPYLYLAQQVLADARVPYQAFDALPLAAEPYAALLDVVLTFALTGGTRETSLALLRSPILAFRAGGDDVGVVDAGALEAVLSERRSVGAARTYIEDVDAFAEAPSRRHVDIARARRAADAVAGIDAELAPFRTAGSAAEQVAAVIAFLRKHERPLGADDPWRERQLRARTALLNLLDGLRTAFLRYDDHVRDPDVLTAAIHHAIEGRTFTPRRGDAGVHLVDAVAARFGEFDHVYVVGLVETDWPPPLSRNIFYSTGMLKNLGWPQQSDHSRAERAAFRDLLSSAARSTRLSAFELDGDSIVRLSPLVETIRDLQGIQASLPDPTPLFADERLTGPIAPTDLDPDRAAWLALRHARPTLSTPAYGGFVEPQTAQAYRVSRVDRYVDCPFKYFAENVLQLPEERDEMSGLTPLERGTLLHAVFEKFYRQWQDGGQGAITPATLPDAVDLFTRIANDQLARLPESDRALEHARLLGSIVGTGVAERVFELEADSGQLVRERWLERDLRGAFVFPLLHGLKQKTIEIRAKADRVDVLEDGSLRVIDYKLGRLPDLDSSAQIAVYAHCARQLLEAADGRPHPVSSAMYLAFGDDRRLEGKLGRGGESAALAVETRVGVFAEHVERIERGEFPPEPRRPGDCQWCAYVGVCRKEYRMEGDEAADAV